jgi:large repetitive protein
VADLGIAITDAPDPVLTGTVLTYTIDVTNAGPSDAASLAVTHALPTGAAFTSAVGSGWSCAEASGIVTCTRPSLAPGSAPAITVEVTAPAVAGAAVSNVWIGAGTADPSSANDTASAETTVQ